MYRRIILAIVMSMVVVLIALGIASYVTVTAALNRALERRMELASMISRHTDLLIQANINRLYDISLGGSVDLSDKDWKPEVRALNTAYEYSIFSDGIFLLDRKGRSLITFPAHMGSRMDLSGIVPIEKVIQEGRPLMSDVITTASGRKVLYALVPLKDRHGTVVGAAGGEINPTNRMFTQVITGVSSDPTVLVEIVDSSGIVIDSNSPARIFTGADHNRFLRSLIKSKKSEVRRCHVCHAQERSGAGPLRTNDILAFAPLTTAPWGISILQPESEVFAPANRMKKQFALAAVCALSIGLVISVGMSRSIVRPVHDLIEATHNIASGNMSRTVGFGGVDEIGMLSSSFEVMRLKLSDSLDALQQYNAELEQKVDERTKKIGTAQRQVEQLLKKLISAQEDERKRIARGLHDDTMQALSALIVKLETLKLQHGDPANAASISEMQEIAVRTLTGLRTLIQNLRPSILDDLGLEAAIRWLLEKHLGGRNMQYYFEISGSPQRRFAAPVETTIFRIVQEAVANIARHSEAKLVSVSMVVNTSHVEVQVEDDGAGFDLSEALRPTEDGRGLGLMGMKERAHLIGGILGICASPGGGARILLSIPLEPYGERNEKDQTADRR